MSLFTSRMRLMSAVVIDRKADAVTRELLSQGVLDFIRVSSVAPASADFIKKRQENGFAEEAAELRRRVEIIYGQAGIMLPAVESLRVEDMDSLRIDEYRKRLEKLDASLQGIRDSQRELNQEILKLQEMERYIGDEKRGEKRFLSINTGKPARGSFSDMMKAMAGVPCHGMESGDTCTVVSLRRDQHHVSEVFSRFQWQENDEAEDDNRTQLVAEEIKQKKKEFERRQEEVRKSLASEVLGSRADFDDIWRNLRMNELYGRIQENFEYTEKTTLFSGWLPAESARELEKGIMKASEGRCMIEWSEAEDFPREKVPVIINSRKSLAPFRMLVENYAVPEYGAIDPTAFVAVAYLAMFGLMFADAGQGLVIMLIGLFGSRFSRGLKDGMKNLMRLFVYCGAASVVTGILFGSYFGHQLFPPVWFDYHGAVTGHAHGGRINNVYDILKITIYFGITVIGTGLVLNWVNLLRRKDYFRLLLDKSGLIGGWFYGCGVYTAFYFVGTSYKELPPSNLLAVFFGLPVIMLLVKAPVHFFAIEKKGAEFNAFTVIDFIMEWIVELLEIFSGYLANTLSFMRVAGLGIAHVSLMTAFATIAAMTGGGIGAVIIIVLGNILVIALEGLSAGIQALRLNYYEFFSRYFTGKGIAYNPVSLRNRKMEGGNGRKKTV